MEEDRKMSAKEIRQQVFAKKQEREQNGMKKIALTKKQKNTAYWVGVMLLGVVLGSVGGLLGIIAAVVITNMIIGNFFE